jgi:calcium channel MID1
MYFHYPSPQTKVSLAYIISSHFITFKVAAQCTQGRPSLSFCSQINYEVALLDQQSLTAKDNASQASYDKFKFALYQYKCDDPRKQNMYSPLRTCEDCLSAYKDWLCATMFPQCSTGRLVRRPCLQLCYRVVQACPTWLRFDCPTEDTLYATYDTNLGTCNSMGITFKS